MSNLCSRLSWIPADIFSVCISPGSDRFCHCDLVSGWCPSENRGGKSCMLSPLKRLHPVQGVQRLHQTHGASWGPSHSDVTSGRQSSLLHYGNHPRDCTGMQVFFQQHATSLYSTKCSKIRKALWRKNLVLLSQETSGYTYCLSEAEIQLCICWYISCKKNSKWWWWWAEVTSVQSLFPSPGTLDEQEKSSLLLFIYVCIYSLKAKYLLLQLQ